MGNVVSPDEMIARFGADSTRMYTLFAAPPDRDLDWQDAGVEGVSRFLSRVYRLVARHASAKSDSAGKHSLAPTARAAQRKLHQTIRRVSIDFEGRWHFNTSIAAIMELTNELYLHEKEIAQAGLISDVVRNLVLLLAPFAPYLAHELWAMIGEESNLLKEPWPKFDAALAKEEEIEIPIQINGKLRSRLTISADASEETIRERALADEKVRIWLDGKQMLKPPIVVPGKLVNIVVK